MTKENENNYVLFCIDYVQNIMTVFSAYYVNIEDGAAVLVSKGLGSKVLDKKD
jgi:hypothetical protein